MKRVPLLLIYSRLLVGGLIVLLSLWHPPYFRIIIISLITYGLLSDIFDGIIARRLGVSNEKMRRLDSGIDMAFWFMVLAGTYIIAPGFFKSNALPIFTVIVLEALTYCISFLRFRKEVATHAILSKIWVLTIFATLLQVIATGNSIWLFRICYYIGIITRMEIVLILLVIRQWTNDVPSVYHAVKIRRGKEIKRSKWLNG